MKKSIPLIIFMVMIMMVVVSWSNISNYGSEVDAEIAMHMKNAQEYEEKEILIDAVTEYQAVLRLKPDDYELAMKIVDLYKELGIQQKYIDACEAAITADKTQKAPYILLADYYTEYSMFGKAHDILSRAMENVAETDDIKPRLLEIMKKYSTMTLSYSDVSDYHKADNSTMGFATAKIDGKNVVVNTTGGISFSEDYEYIGIMSDNLRPIKNHGEYYYINEEKYRKVVPEKEASYLGSFSSGYAPAEFSDGYAYIDKTGKIVRSGYKFAGGFSRGIAAVQDQNGKWNVINSSFEKVVDAEFDDVKLTDIGYCTETGMFFAKQGDKYTLYNNAGEAVAQGFEDAKLFVSKEPAAVKQNGKWGFVDTNGKIVVEPKYEEANSFNAGYAPFRQGKKWGAVNIDGDVLIDPTFDSMRSFSSDGYSLVESEGTFKMVVVNLY